MLKQRPTSIEDEFIVAESMTPDGRMTVRTADEETYEVVDYVDELLAERLSSLEAGDTVTLELLAAPAGESGYAAVRLLPGGAPHLGL